LIAYAKVDTTNNTRIESHNSYKYKYLVLQRFGFAVSPVFSNPMIAVKDKKKE